MSDQDDGALEARERALRDRRIIRNRGQRKLDGE
jgi:hypothetical protein